ncbi:hypothetical protein [Xanthomonas graminis]|uniref:hypothetical protein n=1 Tax=Xanthomonas graminis TaxID=3390026 RepID=UPI001E4659A1|nr:hypothetical protein [Xanthomonas translucens]
MLDVPDAEGEGAAVMLVCSHPDPALQRIDRRVVILGDGGTRLFTERRRYVWPSELDLMAQIAGLRLQARWGGWCANRMPRAAASKYRSMRWRPCRPSECRIGTPCPPVTQKHIGRLAAPDVRLMSGAATTQYR